MIERKRFKLSDMLVRQVEELARDAASNSDAAAPAAKAEVQDPVQGMLDAVGAMSRRMSAMTQNLAVTTVDHGTHLVGADAAEQGGVTALLAPASASTSAAASGLVGGQSTSGTLSDPVIGVLDAVGAMSRRMSAMAQQLSTTSIGGHNDTAAPAKAAKPEREEACAAGTLQADVEDDFTLAMEAADAGLRSLRALALHPQLKAAAASHFASQLSEILQSYDQVANQVIRPSDLKKKDRKGVSNQLVGVGVANQFVGMARRLSVIGTRSGAPTLPSPPPPPKAPGRGMQLESSRGLKPSEVRRLEKQRKAELAAANEKNERTNRDLAQHDVDVATMRKGTTLKL